MKWQADRDLPKTLTCLFSRSCTQPRVVEPHVAPACADLIRCAKGVKDVHALCEWSLSGDQAAAAGVMASLSFLCRFKVPWTTSFTHALPGEVCQPTAMTFVSYTFAVAMVQLLQTKPIGHGLPG